MRKFANSSYKRTIICAALQETLELLSYCIRLCVQSIQMAGSFFAGLGQTIAGGVATAATLGLNKDVLDWTADGANKVANNAEKAWGKDGEVTRFAEALPGVGYVASAGHGISAAITGNNDDLQRARRAAASSTKSTLVTAAVTGGALVGGPAGAVAGGALGSAAGQCSEKGINHANDKRFQTSGGTYNNFHAGEFIGEMAVDGIMGGVGAGPAKDASRAVVGASLKEVGGGGVKRYATKRIVEGAVKTTAKSKINNVKNSALGR